MMLASVTDQPDTPGTNWSGATAFGQTVPRHLVHRASISEVFLTHSHRDSTGTYLVGAQWPRSHGFFEQVANSWHDPLIAAETVRQAALLVSHTGFGVPLDHRFLMRTLSLSLKQSGLRSEGTPAHVLCAVSCHDIRKRREALAGMRTTFRLMRDGEEIGTAQTAFAVLSPAGYARLRASAPTAPPPACEEIPEPVHPWLAGRRRTSDTVLSPTGMENTWLLRVDQHHPVLFDHPVDHVPGMMLVEAARQAAQASCPSVPLLLLSMENTFRRYAEFSAPCTITVERRPGLDDALSMLVTARQEGSVVFTSLVTGARLTTEYRGGEHRHLSCAS